MALVGSDAIQKSAESLQNESETKGEFIKLLWCLFSHR